MHDYTQDAIDALLDGHADTLYDERGIWPTRLAKTWRARVPTRSMLMMVDASAGVRLSFRTRASSVVLVGDFYTLSIDGENRWGNPTLNLVTDGASRTVEIVTESQVTLHSRADELAFSHGSPSRLRFELPPEREKSIVMWLPHNAISRLRLLSADAPLLPIDDDRPTWLHHGSSISHCLEASSPSETWPALAAVDLDLRLINLAFAGNALLDSFVARQIRDTPANLITLKLGINLVNAAAMTLRSFVPAVEGFLDIIREGHPTTPIVLISPITCPMHEIQAGPTSVDEAGVCYRQDDLAQSSDSLSLVRIRQALESVVARRSADSELHYITGPSLFNEEHVTQGMLPDGLHPSPVGYRVMAANFAHQYRALGLVLEPLKQARVAGAAL